MKPSPAIRSRPLVAACLAAAALGPPAPAQDLASPVEDVARLAEILGASHYLRITCTGRADQSWRTQMMRMLDLEAPDRGRRRDRLVGAFNDGYQRQERRYAVCTPEVRAAEAELAAEGRRLADGLSRRYLD